MHNATILYLVDAQTDDSEVQRTANHALEKGAFLRCVLHSAVPILPFNAMGGHAYGAAPLADHWPEQVASAQVKTRDRAEAIEQILSDVGVSGDVTPMFTVLSDIRGYLAACARSVDMILVANNLRESTDVFYECVHAGLFDSPVGVLLNTSDFASHNHIFLAWDDTDAASHAIHKSLPLLIAAKEVTIGCFDPVMSDRGRPSDPGADIAAWLTRHNCSVTLAHYPSGGLEIGKCILGKAAELGCDLIVMGAYGHSRVRQAIFGGTTRTLLEQTKVPVFFGH